jgi:hypothetical protein
MTLTARQVSRGLLFVLLAFIVLFTAEQLLLKLLDWRAKWRDDEFKAYLANPGPRNEDSRKIYGCQYRSIAWFYRYRLCVLDVGMREVDSEGIKQPYYYLILIGTTGHLSPISEENGDRITWDGTYIWVLDKDLRVVEDLRKGLAR